MGPGVGLAAAAGDFSVFELELVAWAGWFEISEGNRAAVKWSTSKIGSSLIEYLLCKFTKNIRYGARWDRYSLTFKVEV